VTTPRITTIAINAMGGHGGGVLANWIAETAEHVGYHAQVTSVPGFAQRSGATIYYVELFPFQPDGRVPVFALMAVPGDVDMVVTSELTEAGRSVLRGLVTQDRTTLISSSHREYTTEEKLTRSDSRRDSSVIFENCEKAAQRFIAFDMREAADQSGCPISAVLFGAIAGSGALPFDRAAFEETIRRGGVAIAHNLKGFGQGHDRAAAGAKLLPALPRPMAALPGAIAPALLAAIEGEFPPAAVPVLKLGVARLVDYQNEAYARLYLDRVRTICAIDTEARGYALTIEVARLLALRMANEDVIRVADIKTRRRRFDDVVRDNRLSASTLWDVSEYLAPRPTEICDLLPVRIGRWLSASPRARRLLTRMLSGGFTVRSSRIPGFLLLYTIARLRWLRPYSLGHAVEAQLIEDWLQHVIMGAATSYAFAEETAQLLTLVRGYGSTLERGRSNYRKILSTLDDLRGRADSAARLATLREAALADEDGAALNRAVADLVPHAQAA
jgi:indolepyruvate ferredoxin oxidoreductase, beta subunit